MSRPCIFISYSHDDHKWLEELRDYLYVAFEEFDCELFTDKDIEPGEHWEEEIVEAMEKATVAILLVSVNSLTSKYIRQHEIPYLQTRELPIIPVILRPCPWKGLTWLKSLKVLPSDGQPLAGREQYEIEQQMTEIASTLVKTLYADAGQHSAARRGDRQWVSSRSIPRDSGIEGLETSRSSFAHGSSDSSGRSIRSTGGFTYRTTAPEQMKHTDKIPQRSQRHQKNFQHPSMRATDEPAG